MRIGIYTLTCLNFVLKNAFYIFYVVFKTVKFFVPTYYKVVLIFYFIKYNFKITCTENCHIFEGEYFTLVRPIYACDKNNNSIKKISGTAQRKK